MLPEQQQRILGYFIEEARDHLNTIEQGLLNLQSTLNDPEMINEVFRAAHSIKGGAAMLGLNSIQHTSHRLEDCFKILKENPIEVDQKLESLFLGVADTLKALLENLSGPYGLSEETANNLMSETEPVFQWLNQHLELLVQQATNGVDSKAKEVRPAFADNSHTLTEIFMERDFSDAEEDNSFVSGETSLKPQETTAPTVAKKQQNWSEFQIQVMQTLREMLQLFKQGTTPQSRQSLQQCCQQLLKLGEAFNLPKWCNLCKAVTNAIANPDNSYLTLAKIVITEIKTAQELVLQGKDADIVISQQLEVLLSFPDVELFEMETTDLVDASEPDLFADHDDNAIAAKLPTMTNDVVNDSTDSINNLFTLSEPTQQEQAIPSTKDNTSTELPLLFNSMSSNEDDTPLSHRHRDPKGPEVGIAELNTLADLFEGETPELDETWQQEEILDINAANNLGIDINSSDTDDTDSDLADLLSFDDDKSIADSQNTIIQTEDFGALFGEISPEKEKSIPPASEIPGNHLVNQNVNLENHDDESIEEFADILLEYPGDIAPPDVVRDLLELALDENKILLDGELKQINNEAITGAEIYYKEPSDLNNVLSDNLQDNSLEEITPVRESKLDSPQPELLAVDNLFTEIPENTQLSANKSEILDLSNNSSKISREVPSATDNLPNFWDEDVQTEQQLELDAAIEQDVAQALEESLFTAANDFFSDSESILPPPPTTFDLQDFDRTILQTDEQIDLILSADAGMDLFAKLTPTDTTNIPVVNEQEEPAIDISSLLAETSDVSDELRQRTPLSSTSLPPEPLDFTPEFTNQPTENLFANASSSVNNLDDDLFNIDTPETTVVDNTKESTVDSSLDFGGLDAFDTPELTVAETPVLNVDNQESAVDSSLDFGGLDVFDNPELTVGEPPVLNLDNQESVVDSALDFGGLDMFATPATTAETPVLNLDNQKSVVDSALDFGGLDMFATPATTAETPVLNLDNQESVVDSAIDFGGLDAFDTPELTVGEPPVLNLDNQESVVDSALDFGGLDAFDTPELTVGEPPVLNLDNQESVVDSALDFGGLDAFDTPELTVGEPPVLNVDNQESVVDSALDFGGLDAFDTPATTAETPVLNVDNQESVVDSAIDFGGLDVFDNPELTVGEPPVLNLDNQELAVDSAIDFGGLDVFDNPELTVGEPPVLNLDNQESVVDSAIDFGGLDVFDNPPTTAETPVLNLDNQELAVDSAIDFGGLDVFDNPELTVDEPPALNLDNRESVVDSALDFGGLDAFDTPELTVGEPPVLNLDNQESVVDSALDFGGLDAFDTPELTVAETPALNLDNQESAIDSALDFGGLDAFDTPELEVAETPGLNLEAELAEHNLDVNSAEISDLQQFPANLELEESLETVADNTELSLIDELSETENTLREFAGLEDLLQENTAIAENSFELNLEEQPEAEKIAEQDNLVVANNNLEVASEVGAVDEFADLETLLKEEFTSPIPDEDFAALEALLDTPKDDNNLLIPAPVYPHKQQPVTPANSSNAVSAPEIEDEFGDLEKLLAEADQTISHSPSIKPNANKTPRPSTRRPARFEETMKVPVKQLDDMSNLVGELVVNRNTLEQDQERLRQSLDNLLIQVQQLSDVGARMQELYERSLLEASLLATRKNKETDVSAGDSNSDRGFSELEMDRFTPFHTLSQEMIEMIVRVRESASDIDFVTEETERVARQFRQVTTQLQEGLTRARMVPFSQAIDRLRRGVRDNAIKYGKQVELVIEGGDTLIDKMILDHLTDPLTHMLNNAIAHGIETPEVRQAAGKKPVGEITIRAFHQGNQTVISVGDDGAGIDTERIKAKALRLGMLTPEEAKAITRIEIYDLLFQSGFSIKDKADEISGRGVGMDVVRSEISEIRGAVNTDSTLGKGTTFTIRLPLTLSICKALCCVSDRARIAFPMDGVEDTLDIPVKNIQETADGQSFIAWRDTILPFRPLKEILAFNRTLSRGNVYGGNRDDDMVSVVVVRSGNNMIALQIDQVLSEQEIVIKQFEGPAPKPLGVAGATVLGDGRIMPIADVLEIIDIFQGRMLKQTGASIWQQKTTPPVPEVQVVKIDPTVLIVDDSITVRELLSLTFNKAGYRVEQARDGQEAWDKLRSGLPCDIVFCDIEMPRCDGLELLSRIQKDSHLNQLPIAMLTSRGADKHRQMAIQLGASGYFTKPYLEEALLEAAVRMLKGEKLIHGTGA